MMKVNTTNIQDRKGRLYFRIKVPTDCQPALGGKREIKKSLGLKADDKEDQAKAIIQVGQLSTEWNETFDRIRNSDDSQKPAVAVPGDRPLAERLREQVIHRNAVRLLDDELEYGGLPRAEEILHNIRDEHEQLLKILYDDQLDEETLRRVWGFDLLGAIDANKDFTGIEDIRNSEYDTWEDDEEPTDLSPWTLAEAFGVQNNRRALRSILRVLRDELEFIASGIIEEYPRLNLVDEWSPLIKSTQASTADNAPDHNHEAQPFPAQKSLPVSEVLDECLAAKTRTEKNNAAIRHEVSSFLEWHGLDGTSKSITAITIAQIIDYRDNCLSKIPANANKLGTVKGLSLRKQVAHGHRHGLKTISTTTVNNRLTCLATLFGYAKKKHYIPNAIGEGLHLVNPTKQAKLPGATFSGYSTKQMTDLMAYLEEQKTEHKSGYEWRYWIPVLLAYTGCRANEVAMLTPDDIKKEDDIWYLDLKTDDQKKQHVKNMMSVRRVPICQKLIDLGFITYVDSMRTGTIKQRAERRLWNTLTYCEKNRWVRQLYATKPQPSL